MSEIKEKIRIKLESFDHELLNQSCEQILEKVNQTDSKVVGPVPLPTQKRIYCVLRSPHVNKDAREHFEIRVHKRVIDIYPSSVNTAHSIVNINLPSGVTTTIK
uniref:ribosomal protein S10 n=1 Tax=Meringosphaera mediterranea TaxID=2837474 RepID=UPI00286A6F88|nr:ribosomal protein S10 [Meringosphaera mediterranea]WLD05706.1 ribosomal protein S10 [Meringosphaera mediterranea]WLD05884.1 ribosomal protein S10 [Meringosphaera mediterranea]WLD06104.1 ribosomal protein S10 [Meringosphaera mediterranea]